MLIILLNYLRGLQFCKSLKMLQMLPVSKRNPWIKNNNPKRFSLSIQIALRFAHSLTNYLQIIVLLKTQKSPLHFIKQLTFIFHLNHIFHLQPNRKETIRTQKRKLIKFPIKYLYGKTNTNIRKRKQKTHSWIRLEDTPRCASSISSFAYPSKIPNSIKKQKLHQIITQKQNNSQKESFSQLKRTRKGMDSYEIKSA